ncbi:ATPase, T2SS/T4P/T4SS family [Pseudofrankia sp. BMG5.36]|uniref:CpaF family protein n=2 Tax=unclassified Pseudofrankia TaxID=2994372 RepID=UPI0009F3A8E6|nr:ATPase, T2SS/T4P/T4SS family [Pseudofrankia sp. BMG5.36]
MTAPVRGVPAATIDGVRDRLADVVHPPTRADVARALAEVAGPLREEDREATRRVVTAELLGAGPLDELLADPAVTDVLVNGPAEVWADRGGGLERADVWFADDDTVRRLATRLAASGGRRLDAAAPFADARLPDGTRLHAVLTPVAIGGTCLSLRRPRRVPIGLAEFVTGDAGDATGTPPRRSAGTESPEAHAATTKPSAAGGRSAGIAARRDGETLVDVLRALVDARLAIAVTGGTGTGKTTLLAALLGCVSPAERVVIVEDTTELALERDNLVRLQGRPPNIEGAGAITQRDLVRQALRMRPDRLVVGEVRGPEVLDLLVAFNTGHEGGLTTVHGNAPGALPARMEALGALAGLSRPALHSLLAAAVQVTVHLRRDDAGRRVVAAVGVLRQDPGGLVRVRPALVATPPAPPEAPGGRMLPADGLPWLRDLLRDRGVALPPPFGSRP